MTPEEYQPLALRTESRPECVRLNGKQNHAAFMAIGEFVAAGKKLDQIKKHLFYGKPLLFTGDAEIYPLYIAGRDVRILHALLGIITEAGEFGEALMADWPVTSNAEPHDETNLKEEAGDLLWYLAVLFDALGTTFPAEMERNINKLRARYPEKFDAALAHTRDLAKERAVLESSGGQIQAHDFGSPVLPCGATVSSVSSETVRVIGQEWCLLGPETLLMSDYISLNIKGGTLVLCHVEEFAQGMNCEIRRVPIKVSELNTI
jgi:NTP pyrophosphatase (non-canonical NTP hydrolase)